MILRETNLGPVWIMSDGECRDYAWICACMPIDRMTRRDAEFIGRMDAKFRLANGGWVSEGHWKWFTDIALRYAAFIQGQDSAVADIRAFAMRCSTGNDDMGGDE